MASKTLLHRVSVVLVRPHKPENVGMAARCLQVFGAGRLVVVSPGFPWENQPLLLQASSGAHRIIQHAVCTDSLPEALADSTCVAGFSRRGHRFHRPQKTLSEWLQQDEPEITDQKIALVFGPEDFGLSNEEKHACHVLIEITSPHPTFSLNLSHAVAIVLYELSLQAAASPQGRTTPKYGRSSPLVRQSDLDRLVALLERKHTGAVGSRSGRRTRQVEVVRSLFQRLHMTRMEYAALIGFLRDRLESNEETGKNNPQVSGLQTED